MWIVSVHAFVQWKGSHWDANFTSFQIFFKRRPNVDNVTKTKKRKKKKLFIKWSGTKCIVRHYRPCRRIYWVIRTTRITYACYEIGYFFENTIKTVLVSKKYKNSEQRNFVVYEKRSDFANRPSLSKHIDDTDLVITYYIYHPSINA